MEKLSELDRSLLIIAGIGFVSGVTQGAVSSLLELLITKRREIGFGSITRKYMYLGSVMAIIYPLLAFAFISISSVSIEAVTQYFIFLATVNALMVPTVEKLYYLIFSDRSTE